MLCCVGLIGGAAVGQALGGPWTVIAPAAGFALGLVADMIFMHGHHRKGNEQARPRDTEPQAKADLRPAAVLQEGVQGEARKQTPADKTLEMEFEGALVHRAADFPGDHVSHR